MGSEQFIDDLEHASCEFCPQSLGTPIGTDHGWTLLRCDSCGHVFLSPRMKPERIQKYYGDHQWRAPDTEQSAEWHIWVERSRLIRLSTIFRSVPSRGEVLELGCGTGDILATLREHGYRVRGIELDSISASHAAKVLGADSVSSEPIERCPDSGRFDAVVMFSVLEHAPHPLALMKEVNRVLKPGGKVIVHVPNLTFLQVRQRLGLAADWQAPGHLHFFSYRTLATLVQRCGFHALSQFWSEYPFISTLRSPIVHARVALNTWTYRILWEASGRRLNFGGSLNVIAEKRAQ
jgi:SAM-dependent methyltransferase